MDKFVFNLSNSLLCSSSTFNSNDACYLVDLYNSVLSELMDKLVPLVTINVSDRENNAPWFDNECRTTRIEVRRLERLYRSAKSADLHNERLNHWAAAFKSMNKLYHTKESQYWETQINDNAHDSSKLWKVISSILQRKASSSDSKVLNAQAISDFFENKVSTLRSGFSDTVAVDYPPRSCSVLSSFQPVSSECVITLVGRCPNKSCSLDPVPTWLIKKLIAIFAPILTAICNASIHSGVVPPSLKSAVVVPVLKKKTLDPNDCKNYRPISNLPFVSKLLERVISAQFTCYLNANHLLPAFQSAYRSFFSTESALLKVTSDISMAADHGKLTLLMMLDLSAAFDTVDHVILLNRLNQSFGLSDTALKWFHSYLQNRTQVILSDGVLSNVSSLACGVPQGSVLGPLLFVLYTVDILLIIEKNGLIGHMYADDTQSYLHFCPNEISMAIANIQECFSELQMWMNNNKLVLNASKTEVIIFGSKHQLDQLTISSIYLGDVQVSISNRVRNLGVTFDSLLSFDQHSRQLSSACFFQIRQIWSIRHCLSDTATEILVHAFISSRLDYCNSLFLSCNTSVLDRLQKIQNAAARLVLRAKRYDSTTPMLQQLHWLKIPERIEFKSCLTTFKCLNDLAPSYLTDFCTPLSSSSLRKNLRSSESGVLAVPRCRTVFYGDKSFPVAGPRLWNDLPVALRVHTQSVDSFKKQLKTHLFKRSFFS